MKVASTTTTSSSLTSPYSSAFITDPSANLIRVTLYRFPPEGKVTLEEFEEYSFERLKVMMDWENAKMTDLYRGNSEESYATLHDVLRGTHLELKTVDDKRKDNLSHWVLEMAMCTTEDDRRRFVQFETALFEYRYNAMKQQTSLLSQFFTMEDLKFTPITDTEKRALEYELKCVYDAVYFAPTQGIKPTFEHVRFYKIPFQEVPELVYSRKNFIRAGIVYVTHLDLCKVLSSMFSTMLNTRLDTANRNVPYHASRDERLGGLLQGLRKKQKAGTMHSRTLLDGEQITLRDLGPLSQRSFPMCGRALTRKLTVTVHHLFHEERLQYQLFLKGLGLSMEDCLQYWQREFTKKKTPDEYRKGGYAYSVRHSYGKEGKRAEYTPWNCVKAISANPGNLQQDGVKKEHGCPFVHINEARQLAKALVEWGGVDASTAEVKIKEIVELARSNQPQLACRKHWELTHPGGNSGEVGNHPNAYVDQSIAYWKEKGKTSEVTTTTTTESTAAAAAPVST